jgi:aryl-alcohol dehydrogenase-like predicted oxidoreductase
VPPRREAIINLEEAPEEHGMKLSDYVTLGRSGLRVSPMCLGTMTFGEDLGWGSSVKDSDGIIDRFLERGGNFIDTANMYTFGHSEAIIGDYLERQRGKRDRLVIATKFLGNLIPGDPNGGGAGRKSLIAAVEQSLRRLKTDRVDLLWMHMWDHHTPIDETLRALDDLVSAGKVQYLGFSDTPAWKTVQAQLLAQQHDWAPLVGLQVEYSLLERTVEGELIPMARELGLGVTPWSPLRSGLLSGRYTRANAGKVKMDRDWASRVFDEKTYAVIDEVIATAQALDTTPASVALAWLMVRPGVTSVIVGARSVEQLDQNLGALEVDLSTEQLARLDAVSRPQLDFPQGVLTGITPSFMHAEISVNGERPGPSPFAPRPGARTW